MSQTGGYAYISSGYPRTDGDIAQLVSPVLDPTESPMCLKFWLNMYGSGIGAMRYVCAFVFVRSEVYGSACLALFMGVCMSVCASRCCLCICLCLRVCVYLDSRLKHTLMKAIFN